MEKFFLSLCLFLPLAMQPVIAWEPVMEIPLQTVHKDTPQFKKNSSDEYGTEYKIKMVKLQESDLVSVPPPTDAVVLYYGEITLGYPPKTYGILIDFEGKDKVLWPDSNGDKDFSDETAYALFKSDRYTGGNIYYSPTPLTFQVKYILNGREIQAQVQMDLPALIIVRAGSGDFFALHTRTWLIGVFEGKKGEQQLAVVDTNDNGVFNDPDDMIFVDKDFDLAFALKEGKKIKYFSSLKTKDGDYKVDFQFCPEKLVLYK